MEMKNFSLCLSLVHFPLVPSLLPRLCLYLSISPCLLPLSVSVCLCQSLSVCLSVSPAIRLLAPTHLSVSDEPKKEILFFEIPPPPSCSETTFAERVFVLRLCVCVCVCVFVCVCLFNRKLPTLRILWVNSTLLERSIYSSIPR